MIRLLIVGGIPFVAMQRYAPMFRRPAFSIANEEPLKWLTAFFIRPSRPRQQQQEQGSDEWTVKVHRHGFHDNEMKKEGAGKYRDTHHHHHNNIIPSPDATADLKQLYRQ